jgi:hypothetical protein
MAGVAVYLAFLILTSVWVLGWAGVSVLVGAFFDLPVQTTVVLGAVLGPLGFMVTILVGVMQRDGGPTVPLKAFDNQSPFFGDPFA